MEFLGNTFAMAKPPRQGAAKIFRELHQMDQLFASTQGMPILAHGGSDLNKIVIAFTTFFSVTIFVI